MKKLLAVVAVVAVGFAFTSCKKDCVCSGTVKIDGLPDITVPETPVGEMSTSDCKAYNYDYGTPGAKADITCKSK